MNQRVDKRGRYRVFALVLTAAAGFTLDALPPQGFNSGRQLRGELQTGRMTCEGEEGGDKHTVTLLNITHW